MYVSADFGLRGSQCHATFALKRALGTQVYASVARCHNSIIQTERPAARVIDERLLLGIRKNAKARSENSFRRTEVPHGITRFEIHEEITSLVGEVQEFVARVFDSVQI